MKKIILIFVLLFTIASSVWTQDTIQYLDSCYLFNERHPYTVYPWSSNPFDLPIAYDPSIWGWDRFCSQPYAARESWSYGYPRSSQQEPVAVYGIAFTMEGLDGQPLTEKDLLDSPYDFIIGRIDNNTFVVVDSTTWVPEKDSWLYYKYSMVGDGVLYEHIVPIYEFYFDSMHLMSDTFYVGLRRILPDDGTHPLFNQIFSVDSTSSIWIYNNDIQLDRGRHNPYWGGMFPIIQPNRRCAVPDAPEWVVYSTTNTVRFTTPYEPGDSLLLSIARQGQPADSGMIYPVTNRTMDIVIPDSGHYTAQLARICQRDIELHSNWSAPASFFIINSLGITSTASPLLNLYPNPASGTVTVGCEAMEGTLEVVDMQGRVVLTALATQHTLDISRLAAGSYFVRLTTQDGSAVRHLQVE